MIRFLIPAGDLYSRLFLLETGLCRFGIAFCLFLCLLSSPKSLAQNECEDLLGGSAPVSIEKLDAAFSEVFHDPFCYLDGYCNLNVQYAFTALKDRIPELRPEHFKVHFLAPPNWHLDGTVLQMFAVRNSRESLNEALNSDVILWSFHVFLSYQGRVYDLDYGNDPKPVPLRDYLRDAEFIQRQTRQGNDESAEILSKEDLLLFEIPGTAYLYLPEDMVKTEGFSRKLVERIPSTRLGDLLKTSD